MVAKPSVRATYQDVLDAPDGMVAEVLFGVLHVNPRPALPHAKVASVLGMDLGGPFDRGRGGPGGCVILDEPERLPKVPDTAFIALAPDWACEVLSRRTSKVDRSDKMAIYAREGVTNVWLVDPAEKTLEVYRRAESAWLRVAIHRDDERVRAEPFDAIELELGALSIDASAE